MYYKNVSFSVKTFYGVTFNPGEIKDVDHYINNKFMILVEPGEVKTQKDVIDVLEEEAPQPKSKQQKPSSEKSKKSEEKKESEELPTAEELPDSDKLNS